MGQFLKNIPLNIRDIFWGRNFAFHILFFALTYILVISGFDWFYFISVRNETLNTFFHPALFGGFLIPMFLPFVLIISGTLLRKKVVLFYGWLLMQAALLGWTISSTYKAFTGRIQPDLHNLIVDGSNRFQFGFWEHGIFWGWPSSHTTVAFSMSFALLAVISKNKKITRAVVFVYALYVGIGVSLAIHWFSDFIAGAILGAVIGTVVGRRYDKQKQGTVS